MFSNEPQTRMAKNMNFDHQWKP